MSETITFPWTPLKCIDKILKIGSMLHELGIIVISPCGLIDIVGYINRDRVFLALQAASIKKSNLWLNHRKLVWLGHIFTCNGFGILIESHSINYPNLYSYHCIDRTGRCTYQSSLTTSYRQLHREWVFSKFHSK